MSQPSNKTPDQRPGASSAGTGSVGADVTPSSNGLRALARLLGRQAAREFAVRASNEVNPVTDGAGSTDPQVSAPRGGKRA